MPKSSKAAAKADPFPGQGIPIGGHADEPQTAQKFAPQQVEQLDEPSPAYNNNNYGEQPNPYAAEPDPYAVDPQQDAYNRNSAAGENTAAPANIGDRNYDAAYDPN